VATAFSELDALVKIQSVKAQKVSGGYNSKTILSQKVPKRRAIIALLSAITGV
jgi:hypothetical protein